MLPVIIGLVIVILFMGGWITLPEKEQEVTAPMDDQPVMLFRDVVKVYPLPAGDVTALDGVSFQVDRGEFISIMGPSGSGKSTLLNLMGCLDTPTRGTFSSAGPVSAICPTSS
jgi:ABC-type glutathione transport system ATPase component